MAASITTTGTSLEAQCAECLGNLELLEQAYNDANPNTQINRVSIIPNPEQGEITYSVTLPANMTVVGGALTQTVTTYL
jgi:hypothetical protein